MVNDNFAGGGGATEGIEQALNRPVDVAINHDPEAIEMHRRNHPETKHYTQDIWTVDPAEVCRGRRVGATWFSPACTHFSRAKGTSTALNAEIRDLAWVVVKWAEAVRPRAIFCENVSEWLSWGPLLENGRPDKSQAGSTWREWVAKLIDLGYEVQWRELVAADYGAPTTRKRLYVIARCDGQPIIWPKPTHGKGRAQGWRAAHEIIDWSLPVRSIFGRKKPLADATERRIAKGIERFVLGAAEPFIIPVRHSGDARCHSIQEPLRTVTASHRGEMAFIEPFIVRHGHYSTITGAGLYEGCGAGTFRGQPLAQPLATVCATNDKNLVMPLITKFYGDPARTDGRGGAVIGQDLRDTLGTVTARDHHALSAAFLSKFYGTSTGSPMQMPLPTVTGSGNHIAEVRAFLLRYNGEGIGADAQLPLPTITAKPRFGLVTVHGVDYEICDIGMRMLAPRELYRAQGFRDSYEIDGFTKETQIRLAGNSVCPVMAKVLVAVNLLGETAVAA